MAFPTSTLNCPWALKNKMVRSEPADHFYEPSAIYSASAPLQGKEKSQTNKQVEMGNREISNFQFWGWANKQMDFSNSSYFPSSHCYCSVYKMITCPRKTGRHIYVWGGWVAPRKTSCNKLSHYRLADFTRSSCPLPLLAALAVPLVLVKQPDREPAPNTCIF